jgi:hypothetical protein
LPSGSLGAGALRFGFPLGSRGTPGVGNVTHCAASGPDTTQDIRQAIITLRMFPPSGVNLMTAYLPALCCETLASYTILPPTIVMTGLIFAIWSAGTVK